MSAHIISLLVAERDRLDAAIAALQGTASVAVNASVADVYDDPTMPEWVKPASKKAPTPAPQPKKRFVSAASRRKMAVAQKQEGSG
jgi:hypothetical protein